MLVGAEFVGQDSVCLVLGDNIFYQEGFGAVLKQAVAHNHGRHRLRLLRGGPQTLRRGGV